LHTFIPCLPDLFRALDGLVCMGGYNTLVEAVSQGLPTVCVPRISPRSEQLLRAQVFERLGLLRCIHPKQLTVEKLRSEVAAVLSTPRRVMTERAKAVLDFEGARRAAGFLLGLRATLPRSEEGSLERAV